MMDWQVFEQVLDDLVAQGITVYTHRLVTHNYYGVVGDFFSYFNQRYQDEMNRPRSRTRYAIHRKAGTRTRNTQWVIGARKADVQNMAAQLGYDLKCTVRRRTRPYMRRAGQLNPRVVADITAIDHTIDGVVSMVEAMLTINGYPTNP